MAAVASGLAGDAGPGRAGIEDSLEEALAVCAADCGGKAEAEGVEVAVEEDAVLRVEGVEPPAAAKEPVSRNAAVVGGLGESGYV